MRKGNNYFEEIIHILKLLKEEYDEQNIISHIRDVLRDAPGHMTEEQFYYKLLEHKENQTIYHNIVENEEINKIIRDGLNLNEIFNDDYIDDLDDK